jgi:hypothetical protein
MGEEAEIVDSESRRLRREVSLSNHGDDNGALPSANVALEMKDLLPGAKNQLPIGDGNGH